MPANLRVDLDSLTTEELRHKAFCVAERRLDVGFFWDLVRHLRPTRRRLDRGRQRRRHRRAPWPRPSPRSASSPAAEGFGDAEPLLRAKFLDYLRSTR